MHNLDQETLSYPYFCRLKVSVTVNTCSSWYGIYCLDVGAARHSPTISQFYINKDINSEFRISLTFFIACSACGNTVRVTAFFSSKGSGRQFLVYEQRLASSNRIFISVHTASNQ